jgi:predicted transcriptional regulator
VPNAKRNHAEIVIDVMRSLSSGLETTTPLYHRANIPWRMLRTILDRLVLAEFAATENRGKRKSYRLTRKGDLVLRQLEEAFSTLSPITDPWVTRKELKLPEVRYHTRPKTWTAPTS